MKPFHLSSLLLLSIITLANTYGDGIIVLDQNNFDEVLSQVKYVVVEFYIPDCTTCHQFAHEFAKTAEKLSSYSPHIKFFEVDASTEKDLVSRYNIKNFPTTRFFIRGSRTPLEYHGKKNADAITQWVLDNYMKASVEVNSIQEVKRYTNYDNVVGLFFGAQDTPAFDQFLEVARQSDDVVFIHTNNDELKRYFNLDQGFILFKRFDEAKNVYTGPMNALELTNFLNKNKYPAVSHYNRDAENRIFYQGHNAIILFREKGQESELAEDEFRKAANDLKNQFVMTIIDFHERIEVQLTELFSVPLNKLLVVNKEDLPAVRLFEPTNQITRYGLDREITSETIKAFAKDWEHGKLKPLFASAPIPKEAFDNNVKVLVGKNFNEEVFNNDDDIVILFCDTNSFNCRKFENIWSKIASQLKGDGSMILAKLDTSVNEIADMKYKTPIEIRIYQKGKKSTPILFEGEQDEQTILRFIRQHTGFLSHIQNV